MAHALIVGFAGAMRLFRMQCIKGAKMKIKEGNIGVITIDDDQRLYRVNAFSSWGLIYLQSIDGALTFKTVLPWHFWVLLDGF
jgi:hypothetical protein